MQTGMDSGLTERDFMQTDMDIMQTKRDFL